jgi:hypothetical protein
MSVNKVDYSFRAASLLKELREDLVDGPTQKPLNKAVVKKQILCCLK